MPLWPDIAAWRGPTPNTSGSITDHMYVVVHTADGSFEGTIAWQRNASADVSSHFVVAKDGRIAQMLDTNSKPWTQKAGNPYSISIENEGNENTALTAYQIEANARILAKAHQVHGIPLQLTGKVGTRGLGHHSMGAESGVDWGHSLCPGSIIKGQKPAILARAKEIVSGVSAQGAFMALTDQQQLDMYLNAKQANSRILGILALVDPVTPNGNFLGTDPSKPTTVTEHNSLRDAIVASGVQVDTAAVAHAIAVELAADPSNPLTEEDVPGIATAVADKLSARLSA